jgi:hypothetical protein
VDCHGSATRRAQTLGSGARGAACSRSGISNPGETIRAHYVPPENWKIDSLELYPIRNTENKKWAFQFTFTRLPTSAERQAASLDGTVGQSNSSQDNIRYVILLHDGTVIEPSLTQK